MNETNLRLNTLKPAPGSHTAAKRVGRGIGSGLGKTSGRGHKGYLARSGSGRRLGFEGGQMPLQRRIPKSGFYSYQSTITAQVRLHEINSLTAEPITVEVLKQANVIKSNIKFVKIFKSGEISNAVTVQISKYVGITAGARAAIQEAGGKILEEQAND
ncbi:MAG: 50S ribosomal protein L15 [Gammaproteobacteria bacterium]